MNEAVFETRVPGKWILAGEHAVLRGARAIAMPHEDLFLNFRYEKSEEPLNWSSELLEKSVTDLVENVDYPDFHLKNIFDLKGRVEVKSDLPIGSGFGSSAALCVALVRWMDWLKGDREPDLRQIRIRAQILENYFHGKSSGIDIAVCAHEKAVGFLKGRQPDFIEIEQMPFFTFHNTGEVAETKTMVAKVEKFIQDDPEEGKEVDEQMMDASDMAWEALKSIDGKERRLWLDRLAAAMNQAQSCFKDWGLVTERAQKIEADLISRGARAVKMTGSGGGGFIVALWPDEKSSG